MSKFYIPLDMIDNVTEMTTAATVSDDGGRYSNLTDR